MTSKVARPPAAIQAFSSGPPPSTPTARPPAPRLAGTLLALALASSLAACGGTGDTGGSGGSGEGGSGVGPGGSGAGGSFGNGGSTGSGSNLDESSACATSAVEGKTLPVVMFIMFDKSGSMLEDQKWSTAKAALTAFFQDPATNGLSVGLRFFPDDSPAAGCNDQQCSIDACSQPLVPPAPLSDKPSSGDPQQKALIDAVDSKSPGGETPMYAALGGAESWATTNAQQGTTRTVVVLVTDGEPTTCNTDVLSISNLAKNAHDSAGVLTYAIGMPGSSSAQLDQIAAAGGTTSAFIAPAGDLAGKLVEALLGIQKSQIACSFDMPTPSGPGDVIDPGKVNVNYYDGSGTFKTMPKAAGLDSCPTSYAWYYDDPANPKTIQLCPSTCAELQNNPDALIKILLGCETVVK